VPILTNKAVMLIKQETTYGVDAVPTVANDLTVVSNPNVELQGKTLEKKVVMPTSGKLPGVNIEEGVKITFTADLVITESGFPLTKMFEACNMVSTVLGGEQTLKPKTQLLGKSLTIYYYKDTLLHKAIGCVGSAKIKAKVGEIITVEFEYQGMNAGISDVTFPSNVVIPDYTPVVCRDAVVSLGGTQVIAESFNLDLGNAINKRVDRSKDTGIAGYFILSREIKGDFDPEITSSAVLNSWKNSETKAVELTVTATVGVAVVQFKVILPKTTYEIPKLADREGIATYQHSFKAHPVSGDDELSIIIEHV